MVFEFTRAHSQKYRTYQKVSDMVECVLRQTILQCGVKHVTNFTKEELLVLKSHYSGVIFFDGTIIFSPVSS